MKKKFSKLFWIAILLVVILVIIFIITLQKAELLPPEKACEMFEELIPPWFHNVSFYPYTSWTTVKFPECPYDVVNQPSCFTKEFCSDEPKEIKFNEGIFRYLKEEKLESLSKDALQPIYCECVGEWEYCGCVGETGDCSKGYCKSYSKCSDTSSPVRCVNKNKDITYLFYWRPAPCVASTFYILPKLSDSIEDLVKPEFLLGDNCDESNRIQNCHIKEKTDLTLTAESFANYRGEVFHLDENIIIEPDRIVLRSEQITCP